jgi:hypothetical protein
MPIQTAVLARFVCRYAEANGESTICEFSRWYPIRYGVAVLTLSLPRCGWCAWYSMALVLLAGCDITGEYEKRFQESLQGTSERAALDAILFAAETEITGEGGAASGVKLRLPSLFDSNSKSLASEPRAQPPFVKLPGFGYSLERALTDNADQFAPAYIYFAAVPKADQTPDQVQAPIATAMKAAFPSAAWSDVQANSRTIKMIRGDGQQEFDLSGTGGAVQQMDGRFVLYFIEGPGHYALIGFRAPKAQGDRWQFDASIDAAMGTVSGG